MEPEEAYIKFLYKELKTIGIVNPKIDIAMGNALTSTKMWKDGIISDP